MGTDYVGQNGKTFRLSQAFHLFIYNILRRCDANLNSWSYVNDGVFVPSSTCKEWARLIKASISGLRIITVQGPVKEMRIFKTQSEVDQYLWFPWISGKQPIIYDGAELNYILDTMTELARVSPRACGSGVSICAIRVIPSISQASSAIKSTPVRIDSENAIVESASSSTMSFLAKFADFMENCGGCNQW